MSIAAKHMDPIVGVDIHIILIPTPAGPVPTPLPNPFVGMVFDPFDYIPFIGATTYINGLPRAQAGTGGIALVPHMPIGGPFGPPPGNEAEVFMGSSTVAVDGDAQSHLGLLSLSCQSIGSPAPMRLKGQPAKSLVLPLSVVLSIPMGRLVLIGGPPTISLMALGMRAIMALAGPLASLLRRAQRGTGRIGRAMRAATRRARRAGNALADALRLGPRARARVNRAICFVTGHPVDIATGKVFTDQVDFELTGYVPFKWERVWYSTSTYDGPLGHGWHHAYDAGLYVTQEVVLYRTPDGRLVDLPPLKEGEEFFERSERITLRRSPGGYSIRTAERMTYRFRELRGAEAKHKPAAANAKLHVLASIDDDFGPCLTLNYDTRGNLAEVVDVAGRSFQLSYDRHERIVEVSAPHPSERGQRFVGMRYTYDNRGDLVQTRDALGHKADYAYKQHLLVKETNRNGLSFYFTYDSEDEHAKCIRTWGDDGIYDHKLTYDVDMGCTVVENSLGHKTKHFHDGALVTKAIDANGGVTQYAYNEHHECIREIDPVGGVTVRVYDERGHVTEVVGPGRDTLRLSFGADDTLTQLVDPNGAAWVWSYDEHGHMLTRTDPLGHVTSYVRAPRKLVAVVDPAGNRTQLEYDSQLNLTAVYTPDSHARRLTHDVLSRSVTYVEANGSVQRCEYDLLGRPTRLDEPDGNVRKLQYDPEGNVVRVIDAHNDVSFSYQGMGRLASRSQAGTKVRFDYDTEEQLIGIINEHGHVYRFELGATGDVLVEHGFDAIRRQYVRDLAGRVTNIKRAGGLGSIYRYDAAGRVRAVEHSDGTKENYAYRADGVLLEAANEAGRVQLQRDALGRIVRESSGDSWVSSEYNPLGLRIRMQSSQGADQRIERNVMGDVIGVRHASAGTTDAFEVSMTRDALGLELARALPGGVRARWQRDQLGRPLKQEISVANRTLRTRSYHWAPDDRLRQVVDTERGEVSYGHDALGKLAWARYGDGSQQLRMPNAVGNLFRTEDRSDRQYGPAGQLLEAVDTYQRVTHYTYDAEGNLLEKRRSDGRAWRYRWNAAGMLSEVHRPDGRSVNFEYDALGRRLRKTFGRQITRWLWDGNVPLHEWLEGEPEPLEAQSNVAYLDVTAGVKARAAMQSAPAPRGPPSVITWLFEPESFAPMAKLVAGRSYAIVTDHLGTPNTMLDERGDVVWSADIGVWGELRGLERERSACPFRWPGQYDDVETGLYYNRFRYYDPEAGQYCSQDPIGLAGGDELYAYVDDPATWVDPFGLSKECGPRRTKHVENRHINRSKYPGKSKYRKPSQVDKLNARAIANPDTVVNQGRGRIRYEKDFGRQVGTRGETMVVVVVDVRKNKIVTSFPMLAE
ncbi:MAG: hypothetical protein RL701_4610 [Pseudomonadota bacterium]